MPQGVQFKCVWAPPSGLWRIGRGSDPLRCRPPEDHTLISSKAGNRYDLANPDTSGVLYFGSSLETCFGEVLARHRPDPKLVALLQDEWQKLGFMDIGAVSADWRQRRSAVHILVTDERPFLDVEDEATIDFLRGKLALGLAALGMGTLTPEMLHGDDRRVTRLIADWTYRWINDGDEPPESLSGIRYASKLDSGWECWAMFGDVMYEVVETIPITKDLPELQIVAKRYGLTVH